MVKKENNKKESWWGRKSLLSKICVIIGVLFLLYIIFILTFVFIRPFQGEITQDRPIIRKLCEMQNRCDASVGPYGCSFDGNEYPGNLIRWKGYNGCNESTKGYHYNSVNNQGKINVESCNCDGIM